MNASCVFPFTVQGTTYYACTYDFNFITGHKPWCSTKTDENGKHISGNWGVCDDKDNCNISPRRKLTINLLPIYVFKTLSMHVLLQ